MKYIAIRMKSRDTYVQHLEKLSNEGGRVISAGMAENSTCSCYEWWAIVEKQNEAQQTPETPKDENADVLEAAKKIKEFCGESNCRDCMFSDGDCYCMINSSAPEYWRLEGRGSNV